MRLGDQQIVLLIVFLEPTTQRRAPLFARQIQLLNIDGMFLQKCPLDAARFPRFPFFPYLPSYGIA